MKPEIEREVDLEDSPRSIFWLQSWLQRSRFLRARRRPSRSVCLARGHYFRDFVRPGTGENVPLPGSQCGGQGFESLSFTRKAGADSVFSVRFPIGLVAILVAVCGVDVVRAFEKLGSQLRLLGRQFADAVPARGEHRFRQVGATPALLRADRRPSRWAGRSS